MAPPLVAPGVAPWLEDSSAVCRSTCVKYNLLLLHSYHTEILKPVPTCGQQRAATTHEPTTLGPLSDQFQLYVGRSETPLSYLYNVVVFFVTYYNVIL